MGDNPANLIPTVTKPGKTHSRRNELMPKLSTGGKSLTLVFLWSLTAAAPCSIHTFEQNTKFDLALEKQLFGMSMKTDWVPLHFWNSVEDKQSNAATPKGTCESRKPCSSLNVPLLSLKMLPVGSKGTLTSKASHYPKSISQSRGSAR